VDIRTRQADILAQLAVSNLTLPVVVVVEHDHDFIDGYPWGCAVQDLVAVAEIGSSLFWQRIRLAVSTFNTPLQVGNTSVPFFSLLQSIVNHTSDWIILKDLKHRFLLASDSFLEEAGLTLDELIGKNDLDIGNTEEEVHGNPATGWAGFWAQDDAVTDSGQMTVEMNPNWTLYSRRPHYKRTLRVPLKNARGEVYALLVCVHDITELKQNEMMLRERTEMLTRVTLEKKRAEENRRVAEMAVTAKNKFLAAASHDLRQPLHAMGLFLDVLERRLEGTDNLALMQRVKQSCVSLSSLFNSLLDISRLDAGVVETDCENIPSARLLSSLREDFRQQAANRDLDYIDSCDSSVLYSDFILLSRVVRNLVVNAIENTTSGCITVTCHQSNDNILLSVGDTGCGIPEQERALIFTEFHQIDSQVAERGRGLGLGLAIVKRLCELLLIEISLQSTPGKGSCFMLRIPVGNASAIEPAAQSATSVSLAGVTVLVVDDEAEIREGMQALLRSYHCHTGAAADTDEAIALLRDHGLVPDIIVADYQLAHGLTGDGVIDGVREFLKADVPALLVTGDTSRDRLVAAAGKGLAVVYKPVDPDQLVNAIARELQR